MYYNSTTEKSPDINLTYKEVDGLRLPLSVYLPENFDSSKKYPAVIIIHGGAWRAVTADSAPWDGGVMRHNALYFAKQGYASITFSYRSIDVSPKTDAKDLICDCNDALEYIKNNFDFIDTRNVIFMGDSAGGHLVLALGMELTLEKVCIEPQIIVACNPVTDCMAEKWKYCANSSEDCQKISPMENIKKINSKILLMHGLQDTVVTIEDSRKFYTKMKAAGNDIEIIELPDAKHAFILFRYRNADKTVSDLHEIIDNYLYQFIKS